MSAQIRLRSSFADVRRSARYARLARAVHGSARAGEAGRHHRAAHRDGRHKARLIRAVVEAGLCNALIPDLDTACSVVGLEKQKDSDDIAEVAGRDGSP